MLPVSKEAITRKLQDVYDRMKERVEDAELRDNLPRDFTIYHVGEIKDLVNDQLDDEANLAHAWDEGYFYALYNVLNDVYKES